MNDIIKWLTKTGFIAVFWVFIFSITIDGRTVFSYANNFLVQNSLVRTLDEELHDLWVKIYQTAQVTFSDISKSDNSEKM